jgi:YesN/AraC family two-component response regulator
MKTIMIVDDNKYFRDALALTIKSMIGVTLRIVYANNGKEASDLLLTAPVDLMVTDIQMPVMDGFELIDYRNRYHPSVAVIVMTGDASPEVMEKLLAVGIPECLEKPFNNDSIVRMIGAKFRAPHRPSSQTDTAAAPACQLTLPEPARAYPRGT